MARKRKPAFGFNDTPATHRELSELAKQAGANIGRFAVDWRNYDPAVVSATAQAMRKHGIKPLYTVGGLDRVRRGERDDFKRFMKNFASTHKGAIEVWNEPNSPIYGGMKPGQYAKLLKAGVRGIRAVDPKRRILSAGLAAKGGVVPYQKRVLKKTRKLDYDLGIHAYGQGPKAVRRTLRSYDRLAGLSNRDNWVTETGIASKDGESRQAKQLRKIYRELAKKNTRSIIIHRLRDDPDFFPGNEWEQTLGLINADGSFKPAFGAISRARRKKRS